MKNQILKLAEKFIKELEENNNDEITIVPGTFLTTRDNIIADQTMWDDDDESKNTDFTTDPFWITTDDGIDPIGITDAEDLADTLEEQLSQILEKEE